MRIPVSKNYTEPLNIDILRAVIRLSLLEIVQLAGKPVSKFNFVKTVINESMFFNYDKYGLPRPLFPNINKRGIFSIDFQRTIDEDPLIIKNPISYDIAPENRELVYEEVKKTLKPENIEYIKNKINNLKIRYGDYLLTQVFGSKDLAKNQLQKYILNRAKEYFHWIISPDYLKTVDTNIRVILKSNSDSLNELTYPYETQESTIDASLKTATEDMIDVLTVLLRDKVTNIDDNKQLWRYQIHALNGIDRRVFSNYVFYVGRITYQNGTYYCEDARYTLEETDKIQVKTFEGLLSLTNFDSLGIIGKVTTINDVCVLIIHGVFYLR